MTPCSNTRVAWQYEQRGGFPSHSPDPNIDVDEVLTQYQSVLWASTSSSTNNLLSNASFGAGSFASWKAISLGGTFNAVAYDDPAHAEQVSWFGESTTSKAGASLYQDVSLSTSVGQSYTFSIWVRSARGVPLSGTLAL